MKDRVMNKISRSSHVAFSEGSFGASTKFSLVIVNCLRSVWRRERRSRNADVVRTDFHPKSGPLGPQISNSLKGQGLVGHNCFRPTSPTSIEL